MERNSQTRCTMKIENILPLKIDIPSALEEIAKNTTFEESDDIDKPISLTQEERSDLTPMMPETRQRLEKIGVPDTIIDSIGSEEEAKLYEDAGLKPAIINDKDTLIRTDIDYDQKDVFGKTNLERMEAGRAPLDKDGRPIELHHIGQKSDSPLAELTGSEHRGKGNDNILHDKQKESEINRQDFDKERRCYWKARAEQIESKN